MTTGERPDFLQRGEPARLIPVVADTSREQRVTSVLLAGMVAVPDLASKLLSAAGKPLRKTSHVSCWTEPELANQPTELRSRADGLIVVRTGKKVWSALVEAKIGNTELDPQQVERYAELARANGVDAVITLSNQFVARADHHPVRLRKSLTNRVGLYHWPWMWVLTEALLLDWNKQVEDPDQAFLIDEIIRYLSHDSVGISGFGHMGRQWKTVVNTVRNGGTLSRNSPDVVAAVSSWQQEERDLCLNLTRHLHTPVTLRLTRRERDEPTLRMDAAVRQLVADKTLSATIQVPGAASEIEVTADLQTRTLRCAMQLQAPDDRKGAGARLNWLTRQLTRCHHPEVYIQAQWPGRTPPTMSTLLSIQEGGPSGLLPENSKLVPHHFQILMIRDTAGRFSGSRTFIEELEKLAIAFYDEVGQHLRAWQPRPPKPKVVEKADDTPRLQYPPTTIFEIGSESGRRVLPTQMDKPTDS
ncbi:MAG: hypothetical protein RLQ25_08525 [Alphaproteobacteria bacterium]|uniref:hypothetical protein n=1 Tax=Marinobacter salarius TaxID=1420917 RepID=UPI0032EC0040